MGGGGKGGGGGGGGGDSTIRYAPYIEGYHQTLLSLGYSAYQDTISTSPYGTLHQPVSAAYTAKNPDTQSFGNCNFVSLFALFNGLIENFNIAYAYSDDVNTTIYSPLINDIVAAEAAFLDNEIDTVSLPRMRAGLADIGAINTSSFVLAPSILEKARLRTIAKLKSDLQAKALELGHRRWEKHLEWNQAVINAYQKNLQLYFTVHFDYLNAKSEIDTRHLLWQWTIVDHFRAIVGALTGATDSKVKGDSKTARGIGGLLAGAAAGAQLGSYIPGFSGPGAAIGGALGLIGGLF